MSLIGVEDRGGVRHLVLQRAEKRNAFNGELIEALGLALEDAAADESVRVLVVRGDGAMFSSGMDLHDLQELSETVLEKPLHVCSENSDGCGRPSTQTMRSARPKPPASA